MSYLDHGTYSAYCNGGCRCAECRRAMAAYHREYFRRRNAQLDPDDSRHGTDNLYTNAGCRCEPCRAARSKRSKRQRKAAR